MVLTLSTTLSLLAIVALAMVNAEPTRGQLQDAPASVVVQTGDTLWQIAVEVAPAEDPAVVVDLLRSANELDGSALRPGQVLVVPRG
ncbi:MAG: LysM peptidoglycan-binding domain-containing protein [Geodermatophilaceae bacterium]|nr:LysM peptidoglycan-binding domain-containing protein [Geodermatophilaceae bacterium]